MFRSQADGRSEFCNAFNVILTRDMSSGPIVISPNKSGRSLYRLSEIYNRLRMPFQAAFELSPGSAMTSSNRPSSNLASPRLKWSVADDSSGCADWA